MWRRIKEERKTEKANKRDKSGWENNRVTEKNIGMMHLRSVTLGSALFYLLFFFFLFFYYSFLTTSHELFWQKLYNNVSDTNYFTKEFINGWCGKWLLTNEKAILMMGLDEKLIKY